MIAGLSIASFLLDEGKMMNRLLIRIITILLIMLALSTYAIAQRVVKYPDNKQDIKVRWNWGLEQSREKINKDGFWLGYSIQRLMGENSFIGCFNTDNEKETSLSEMIYGKNEKQHYKKIPDDEVVREAAKKVLKRINDPDAPVDKVVKEVAVLFRFENGNYKSNEISEIVISNLSLHVDLENSPLIWLGKVTDYESVTFLEKQYKKVTNEEAKEDLITAISLHQTSDRVINFLGKIIFSKETDELRGKAVFWIAEHETERVLKILIKTVEKDRSVEVREKAVFSLSRMKNERATEALIDLAYRAKNREIRKKAIFWLGQKASKKSVKALKKVVNDDSDYELQKRAVFALSQLPDNKGVPHLIKIAKTHSNREIRKKAIFWLGQSADPRALETLVKIVRK